MAGGAVVSLPPIPGEERGGQGVTVGTKGVQKGTATRFNACQADAPAPLSLFTTNRRRQRTGDCGVSVPLGVEGQSVYPLFIIIL